ncbi:MAG: Flp pilus assembly protein TadG [Myxococcota bacterium]|jgi:Flp pilus assembly protein TadG
MARVSPQRKRRGVAAVEFALTLPVFLLAVTGVVELSHFISNFHHVQRAARDGARVGSVTLEGPGGDGSIIQAAAAQQAIDVLESSTRPCEDGCDVVVDVYSDDGRKFVTVTVAYPYTPLTWMFGQLADQSVAQFTMMTQQQ